MASNTNAKSEIDKSHKIHKDYKNEIEYIHDIYENEIFETSQLDNVDTNASQTRQTETNTIESQIERKEAERKERNPRSYRYKLLVLVPVVILALSGAVVLTTRLQFYRKNEEMLQNNTRLTSEEVSISRTSNSQGNEF